MFQYLFQHIQDFISNFPEKVPFFIIIFFVGFTIQIIKIIIDYHSQKTFSIFQFLSSGGFPSSHTGIASSLTTLILLEKGIYSIEFAIALTFSVIVAYDAMNVRYQSGEHARYLNELRKSLQGVLTDEGDKKVTLKERLGHTPFEVLWGMIFGIIMTFILYYILYV